MLLTISGGSDALCALIGRSRYHLLISFLPLTSAISGNVGLQCSEITTKVISHDDVAADSLLSCFTAEVGTSLCLAAPMSIILGLMAYVASGMDVAFGMAIMIAQFVSIAAAGCTGSVAPLVLRSIFSRNACNWNGFLVTAIQDIVGSISVVVLSYQILVWLGASPVDATDVCGSTCVV